MISEYRVQEYDVTKILSSINTLDVEVGEGWHLGRISWGHRKIYSDGQAANTVACYGVQL